MDLELEKKTAIVTGGSQGIGYEIALSLAEEGANIVIADTNTGAFDEVVRKLESKGVKAAAIETDVSDGESVKYMVKEAVERFGRIDVLINNAGIGVSFPLLTHDESAWERILDVNLNGVFLCTREVRLLWSHKEVVGVSSIFPLSSEGEVSQKWVHTLHPNLG